MAEQIIIQEALVFRTTLARPYTNPKFADAKPNFALTFFVAPADGAKVLAALEASLATLPPAERIKVNKATWLPTAAFLENSDAPSDWVRIARYQLRPLPCVDINGAPYATLEAAERDIYPGCFVSVALHAYATSKPSVSIDIDGVKKLRDGERLKISAAPANPFVTGAPSNPFAGAPVKAPAPSPVASAVDGKLAISAAQMQQLVAAGMKPEELLAKYVLAA